MKAKKYTAAATAKPEQRANNRPSPGMKVRKAISPKNMITLAASGVRIALKNVLTLIGLLANANQRFGNSSNAGVVTWAIAMPIAPHLEPKAMSERKVKLLTMLIVRSRPD
jgi:hypothetical protein